MIRETTYHTTQQEAETHGKAFKDSWGWEYSPSYSIGFSGVIGKWCCFTCRYDSCD
jgi:hypothetical protein